MAHAGSAGVAPNGDERRAILPLPPLRAVAGRGAARAGGRRFAPGRFRPVLRPAARCELLRIRRVAGAGCLPRRSLGGSPSGPILLRRTELGIPSALSGGDPA